jgi:transcriptional regulator with XRE-family HTH domain
MFIFVGMKSKEPFSLQIWKLRKLKGVTQQQIADAMGYANASFISQIETGRENITPKLAFELLQAIKDCYKANQLKIKAR